MKAKRPKTRKNRGGRPRTPAVQREPNGRIQRGPDRGTEQLQKHRRAVLPEGADPAMSADPLDILLAHRAINVEKHFIVGLFRYHLKTAYPTIGAVRAVALDEKIPTVMVFKGNEAANAKSVEEMKRFCSWLSPDEFTALVAVFLDHRPPGTLKRLRDVQSALRKFVAKV